MKQTLQNLLAEGKTKQVIAELRQLTIDDTELKAEIVQLSARFATMERQTRMELADSAELNLEQNRINKALLSVIDRLTDVTSEGLTSSHLLNAATKQPFSWTKWTGLNDVKSWIAALAGFVAIFKFCVHEPAIGTLKNVSVSVENKERHLIPELTKSKDAYVIMAVEGGDVKKEVIDEKGKAGFANVKVGDNVRLKIDFSEPFHPLNPDSLYTIPADGRLTLTVGLQHLGQVFGRVLWRDQPLEGVLVAVGDLRDTTNDLGRYSIQIPESAQRKEQEVIFKKMSYKTVIKMAHPQTNDPLNIVMEK